ncbi:hypothetical protein GQ43DRAFT_392945 [Delitschia confertaspora ATCC 74209]|uniref:Oxidase ustYa n=1 Tax=Delitschia confertaspora ATCC 74209 TaxID=1513339 RepID=A0A9P4JRR6_9PLEO|nr:hypothetical protein GQ43DRAFT_392945 [Delitschia confertaspora ATCC 74209]
MTSEARYASIDLHDNEDSSTEVDYSEKGDEEKLWHSAEVQNAGKRSKRVKALSIFRGCRGYLEVALLFAILGLLVRQYFNEGPRNQWDFNGDMTGFGPRFSQQIVTFHPDDSYAPNDTSKFFEQETLDKWTELMPKGMGFQWVKDPSKYNNLPKPIDWDPGMTVFTTSVTHQLHCLWAIVQTYSGIKSNVPIPDDHHWHMIHCFDYLRQTIMCSADTALEGHEFTFPDHNGGSDGWDAKHVCKDYSQVKNYLESVRAYDDRQIY